MKKSVSLAIMVALLCGCGRISEVEYFPGETAEVTDSDDSTSDDKDSEVSETLTDREPGKEEETFFGDRTPEEFYSLFTTEVTGPCGEGPYFDFISSTGRQSVVGYHEGEFTAASIRIDIYLLTSSTYYFSYTQEVRIYGESGERGAYYHVDRDHPWTQSHTREGSWRIEGNNLILQDLGVVRSATTLGDSPAVSISFSNEGTEHPKLPSTSVKFLRSVSNRGLEITQDECLNHGN